MTALHALKRRLLAEELRRRRRAGEQRRFAASQRRGRIDPNPHQIDAVVFALRRIPEGGCILADEVGLGKTIEAGLVIAQLLAEGMRRILLIVPKSLLGQWQTELYTLFGIETREGRPDPEAFAGDGVFLVHREFAGGLRGAPLLSSADPFDLVVIDEAHEIFAAIYKRFDKSGAYAADSSEAQIADRVRSFLKPAGTPVLLLTATPIQNTLTELWGLVQYVEPTDQLLGKLPTFREVFCDGSGRGLDDDQAFELRRRLASVVQRTLRRQAQEFLEVPFVERQAKVIEYSMSPDEQRLYDDVTAWLLDPSSCSFAGRTRRLLLIAFHRRLGSSRAALEASLEKVAGRLRRELSDGSAGRVASRHDLLGDELVRDLTAEFEEDADELADLEADDESAPPLPDRFRAELERVEGFIRQSRAIERDSKAECLLDALKVIRERGASGAGTGKVVIFTESIKTQEFLFDLLTRNGYERDAGYVAVVSFRRQGVRPLVRRERVARWTWRDATVRSLAELHALAAEDLQSTVLTLTLDMSVSVAEVDAVERALASLAGNEATIARAGAIVYDRSNLQIRTSEPLTLDADLPESVRETATRLQAEAADPAADPQSGSIAKRALVLLNRLLHEVR